MNNNETATIILLLFLVFVGLMAYYVSPWALLIFLCGPSISWNRKKEGEDD